MNTKSSLILGISLIIGFSLLGLINGLLSNSIKNGESDNLERYEFVRANDTNVIIFDKYTGEYWRKFIPPNEGPTDWEKESSPLEQEISSVIP